MLNKWWYLHYLLQQRLLDFKWKKKKENSRFFFISNLMLWNVSSTHLSCFNSMIFYYTCTPSWKFIKLVDLFMYFSWQMLRKIACLFIKSIKLVCQYIQYYSKIHSTHFFFLRKFRDWMWLLYREIMTIFSSSSDFSAYEASIKILFADFKTDSNLKNRQ